MRLSSNKRKLLALVLLSAGMSTGSNVHAEDGWSSPYSGHAQRAVNLAEIEVNKAYALGMRRFDADVATEIIGWRLHDARSIDRRDGLDSGLNLVWQRRASHLSLSKEGIRLTRRF